MLRLGFYVIVGLLVASCKKDKTIFPYDATPYEIKLVNNTLPAPILPTDNPLTIANVELGRMLFYEPLLSKDESISCASCHVQSNGFSDINRFSAGVDGSLGTRQAMPVFNLAWNKIGFFWDGRAELLRHQAVLPIQDGLEMKETLENVVKKLSQNSLYINHFNKAFGTTEINAYKISLALEAFMFSIVSDDSKYDQYKSGKTTLTESEERGRQLFFAEYNPFFPELSGADCAHCHGGSNFENDQYMNNGLDDQSEILDLGRQKVTGDPLDKGKFKVPSLRNIAVTRPYMHDGRFSTLMEVIDHYNSGVHHSPTTDPALNTTTETGLMLTPEDKLDLINFLNTLTDQNYLTNKAYSSPF